MDFKLQIKRQIHISVCYPQPLNLKMKPGQNAENSPTAAKKSFNAEIVFKTIALIVISILFLFVPGFLRLRVQYQSKGYYVFAISSLLWVACGFFTIFGTRYGYYHFAGKYMIKLVKKKYDEEEKVKKLDMLLKLSYDTFYYLCTTVFCYIIFRHEAWFPSVVGGSGSCTNIYIYYPDWPVEKRGELETYFCFQLGVHIFLLFELIVFRRNKEGKYYEWLLHHIMAVSLILFSMMSNQITLGVMILIIHDASDISLAFTRFYFQAVLPYKVWSFQVFLAAQVLLSWIYMRLIVFPICLLLNAYYNQPMELWPPRKYEKIYLLVLTFVLVAMHAYWAVYISRSIIAFAQKKQRPNKFDDTEKKE